MATRIIGRCLGPWLALALLWPSPVAPQIVERVIDGDTLIIQTVGTVRLIGVDTPETVHPRRRVEPFGPEATQFAKTLVQGKTVRVEYEMERRDRYGRALGYVYMDDGTFLNAEIVKQGYGRAYTGHPFKFRDQFRAYERQTRAAKRGLWRQAEVENPVARAQVVVGSSRPSVERLTCGSSFFSSSCVLSSKSSSPNLKSSADVVNCPSGGRGSILMSPFSSAALISRSLRITTLLPEAG